jgi:hypothetical protein
LRAALLGYGKGGAAHTELNDKLAAAGHDRAPDWCERMERPQWEPYSAPYVLAIKLTVYEAIGNIALRKIKREVSFLVCSVCLQLQKTYSQIYIPANPHEC